MNPPRLLFLYPHLWHVPRSADVPRSLSARIQLRRRPNAYALSTQRAQIRPQTTISNRHGTAVEPLPVDQPDKPRPHQPAPVPAGEVKEEQMSGWKTSQLQEAQRKSPEDKNVKAGEATRTAPSPARKDADTKPERIERKPAAPDAKPTQTVDAGPPRTDAPTILPPPHHPSDSLALQAVTDSCPLDTVLHTQASATDWAEERRKTPPHLEAPPYVHHFDTYTLVKDLGKGGFTQDQSVTIMKAIRSLLAVNLDVAREGLVSKSDVENVCLGRFHVSFWSRNLSY